MDRLESLGNQLSQITMYDIKSMYEQAKNVVLNVSEIEAKVREATNDDPWGASSTLMQEIANRTFNYPDFNEIMPSIYSRFMEKEARQWRQIYKSLQLLEYLIKHGSERVVDDARAHIATIKMLRNFHYIDDKGKDQGINVRNRAKEIVELLSDVEKIRAERRKAKTNKNKYTGQGSDGMSFGSGSYGGFGNDSGYGGDRYGSYGGGGSGGSSTYGNSRYGSGGGGGSSSSFRDDSGGRRGYEEYNAGDDEDVTPTSARRSNSLNTTSRSTPSKSNSAPAPAPAPAPVQEVDLLGGFDDDTFGSTVSAPPAKQASFATDKALPVVGATKQPSVAIDDDDFADFQAAPSSPTSAAPAPAAAAPKMNLMDMLNASQPTTMTASPPPMQTQQSLFNMGGNSAGGMGAGGMGGMGTGAGMGMGMGMGMHRSNTSMSNSSQFSSSMQPTSPTGFSAMRPTMSPTSSTTAAKTPVAGASKPAATGGNANFDDLWSMSLGSSKPTTTAGPVKSMKDLEKEKSSAGLWGGAGSKPPMGNTGAFGTFGGASTGTGNASGGGDDLLL
ncbi:Epsin-3, clathrin recruitment and traffic between the Golgi and endosome [Marasmius crinis-equi]|uniref:Epsin-3, clathrin recruitment and traffic between the Golgi and endosome n=1 Tax=Marasmius crinis-equi TaxID=585013 RepID=A0ABR3EXA5_9AGAR